MAHKCSFCSKTFRKMTHQWQHEKAVHPKALEQRDQALRQPFIPMPLRYSLMPITSYLRRDL